MVIFTLSSFILCALPSETEKYRGTNLEIAVQDDSYQWWLLISIIVSIPTLVLCFLDFFRPWPSQVEQKLVHRNNLISRLLKIVAITVPNLCFYLLLTVADINSPILAQIQNSLFYSQIVAVIGNIFCSTFGNRYLKHDSRNQLDISVEKFTVLFLASFVCYKIFFVLSSLAYDKAARTTCLIISSVFLICGMIIMMLIVFKFARFFISQMKGFHFAEYNQMHDFYVMIGVIAFACYIFGFYVSTNQFSAQSAAYDQESDSLIYFLVGEVILIIYLTIIDQQCAVFEANVKGEQLQARLNLIRYISHEMRSPLNNSFLGLRILRGNIDGIVDTMKRIKTTMIRCKVPDPNGTIVQFVEKIVDEKDGIVETVELVKESCSIALETLNDMLTFDKIDEKKLALEVEDINVWSFVSETVRPFRLNAMKDQVSLQTECVDSSSNWMQSTFIKADKFKLSQVLRNFLSNAMKFSPKRKGKVDVKVERRQLREGEVVRVSVQDNGVGISLENQKRLFGQYVQFSANALQNGQGSGLGLWISKSKLL